jgi:hypothetical protein
MSRLHAASAVPLQRPVAAARGRWDNGGVSEPRAAEKPGRYQRSAGGMVGALVILLLAIGAFVAFRALTRDQPEIRPEPVDYLETVALAQRGGIDVVYPADLPEGWMATSADVGAESATTWGLAMLTDEDRFVGLRQDDDLDALLSTYVDERTVEGEPVEVTGTVAPTWRRFTDEGGDTAYAAEAGGPDQWVLVYGSAGSEDLLTLVGSLTDKAR